MDSRGQVGSIPVDPGDLSIPLNGFARGWRYTATATTGTALSIPLNGFQTPCF